MAHYNYLIIGGGMTAASAIDGMRETDANGTIGVITAETHKPYDRPPLSKALWTGKKTLEEIMRPATHGNVTYHLGRVAQELDLPGNKCTTITATRTRSTSCCWQRAEQRDACRRPR